jgi:hypothetical protein
MKLIIEASYLLYNFKTSEIVAYFFNENTAKKYAESSNDDLTIYNLKN